MRAARAARKLASSMAISSALAPAIILRRVSFRRSRAFCRALASRIMPRIGGFQSFRTARRTIQGFEAMLWLRKGFDFAGAWTVCEQNRLLSVCFGLLKINEA